MHNSSFLPLKKGLFFCKLTGGIGRSFFIGKFAGISARTGGRRAAFNRRGFRMPGASANFRTIGRAHRKDPAVDSSLLPGPFG